MPGWHAAVPAACCSELRARAPELTTFGRVTGGHPEARAGCVIGVHSEPRDRFYEKRSKSKLTKNCRVIGRHLDRLYEKKSKSKLTKFGRVIGRHLEAPSVCEAREKREGELTLREKSCRVTSSHNMPARASKSQAGGQLASQPAIWPSQPALSQPELARARQSHPELARACQLQGDQSPARAAG